MPTRSNNTTQRRSVRPGGRVCGGGTAYLVVIHGGNLGQRHVLGDAPVVIGRSPEVELQIDHRSVSRRHCRIWRSDEGYRLCDLDSTNKTFVNDEAVDETTLHDGDHVGVGDYVLKFVAHGSIEARYHEELYQLATSDPLTGLYNRRQFQELMEKELLRAARNTRPLALALIDIDHFKAINDRHGHPGGDGVIREISRLLRENARAEQLVARIGGEEFAVVYAEESLDVAAAAAERLRRIVEQHAFDVGGTPVRVTVSIGIASWGKETGGLSGLMRAADAQLYQAKRAGRNRVCADQS